MKRKEVAKKMKVKHGESMGFDKDFGYNFNNKYSVKSKKHYEKTVRMKGYDKSVRRKEQSKEINPDDIPF